VPWLAIGNSAERDWCEILARCAVCRGWRLGTVRRGIGVSSSLGARCAVVGEGTPRRGIRVSSWLGARCAVVGDWEQCGEGLE